MFERLPNDRAYPNYHNSPPAMLRTVGSFCPGVRATLCTGGGKGIPKPVAGAPEGPWAKKYRNPRALVFFARCGACNFEICFDFINMNSARKKEAGSWAIGPGAFQIKFLAPMGPSNLPNDMSIAPSAVWGNKSCYLRRIWTTATLASTT